MWEALSKKVSILKVTLTQILNVFIEKGNILEKMVVFYQDEFFYDQFEVLPGYVIKGKFYVEIKGKIISEKLMFGCLLF